MKRSTHRSICLAVAVCTAMLSTAQKNIDRLHIDLAGAWHFVIDENNQFDEKSLFGDTLLLPGTTDTNHKGHPLDRFDRAVSRHFGHPDDIERLRVDKRHAGVRVRRRTERDFELDTL